MFEVLLSAAGLALSDSYSELSFIKNRIERLIKNENNHLFLSSLFQSDLLSVLCAGSDVGSRVAARGPALRRRPAAGRSVALLWPSCGAPGRSY